VWSALDSRKRHEEPEQDQLILRMFEDLLTRPVSEMMHMYTFLLKQLCGKNRYRYAPYVYKMMTLQRVKNQHGDSQGHLLTQAEYSKNKGISHSLLLHEMLAGMLILLH